MKKIIALLLAVFMLVTIVACSPKKVDGPDTSEPVKEPSENTGDGVVTPLWTLNYDKDVWTLYEDDMSDDEDYCYANLQILDPEDPEYYLIDVTIEASVEDTYDFRDDLVYYGFDQYEYAENDSYEVTEIGGVDCLTYENEGWDEMTLRYFNRVESAGATVEVVISSEDVSDSRIADLLAGLSFTLTDIGNEDGPWEWEGEAFTADDASVTAGSFTVDSKWIPFDEYISTHETFDHAVAAVGNTVYLLTDGALKQYAYDGSTLTFEKDIELDEDDFDTITATEDGSLWLSGSMNDLTVVKDGAVSATYEDLDTVVMHSSGTWGVSYFTTNECKKVTFSGDSYTTTDMIFAEVDTIMHLCVGDDSIYVCGSAVDESGHKVFVYNTDGVLQTTLCDSEGEGLGSITYVTKTANGYIGFDGNMRTVMFWGTDGSFIAEVDGSDLFSTGYPWFCSTTLLSDGSFLTVMTEEREDRSATELIAFNVKGF